MYVALFWSLSDPNDLHAGNHPESFAVHYPLGLHVLLGSMTCGIFAALGRIVYKLLLLLGMFRFTQVQGRGRRRALPAWKAAHGSATVRQ